MKGLLLILAGGALVVGVLGSAALAGNGLGRELGSTVTRADLRGVNFVENCRFSHAAPDDPIVFPGKFGASHHHSFVGNRSTNAASTYDSLRAAPTSCERRADTAAYWVPTLYSGTTEVAPDGATIYYRRATLAEVQPFPDNLRMIAGDATATAPQGLRVTFWNCGVLSGVPPSSTIPTCPSGRRSFLRLHIRFPECWNGAALDSVDHKSHMAYAMRGLMPLHAPRCAAVDRAHLPLPQPVVTGRRPGAARTRVRRPAERARRLLQRLAAESARAAGGRLPQRSRALRASALRDEGEASVALTRDRRGDACVARITSRLRGVTPATPGASRGR